MQIARRVAGVELISIDSMQVYRGMDVGTATPSEADQAEVRHHLIDLVEPSESFAVGEFQRMAHEAIDDVASRGGTPVLVGGTGLYLRAVIDDLEIPGRYPEIRTELESETDSESLYDRLASLDPLAASRIGPANRRRVVRALEVCVGSGRPFSSFGPGLEAYPPNRFVQIAIRRPRSELDSRIADRYNRQIEQGFVDEVRRLIDVGLGVTASQALGYREIAEHLAGECGLEEALEKAVARTCRFARRQERWFRRDPRINWLDAPVDVDAVLELWDTVRQTRT